MIAGALRRRSRRASHPPRASAARPSTRPTTVATTRLRSSPSSSGSARQRSISGDDLVEGLGAVKGPRLRHVAVVLADHALRRPRLRGRTVVALVVEDADDRPVVDERVEQDRARVRDDAGRVLQQRGERLEVCEARLLHRRALDALRGGEPLPPAGVARMRAEEERETRVRTALPPPGDEPGEEPFLVRRVRRRVPHHHHERPRGVESVAAEDRLERLARTRRVEDVALGPARHHDALERHVRGSATRSSRMRSFWTR